MTFHVHHESGWDIVIFKKNELLLLLWVIKIGLIRVNWQNNSVQQKEDAWLLAFTVVRCYSGLIWLYQIRHPKVERSVSTVCPEKTPLINLHRNNATLTKGTPEIQGFTIIDLDSSPWILAILVDLVVRQTPRVRCGRRQACENITSLGLRTVGRIAVEDHLNTPGRWTDWMTNVGWCSICANSRILGGKTLGQFHMFSLTYHHLGSEVG